MKTRLDELEVLVLDCQATSSNPSKGHLLELGWTQAKASHLAFEKDLEQHLKSHLVRLPEKTSIPRPVSRVTGIEPKEMQGALPPETVWKELYRTTQEIRSSNPQQICPTIIHFRRYEEPFLRSLHQIHGDHQGFPFEIICTHKIVSRLFPGLPRKTLRAVAGYFGMSLPESRRCRFHVLATAFIWQQAINDLKHKHQITTLDELLAWLSQTGTQPGRRGKREYPMEKKDLERLQEGPGVYHMYRSPGDLLYIGKAKSIKKRVRSYFYTGTRHAEHTLEMLSQARHLAVTATRSALEAAVLESDEIKQLSPPYNRALVTKDRKIVFFSKDLRRLSCSPDSTYAVGPISSPGFLAPLAKLADILEGKTQRLTSKQIETVLNIPREYIPEKPCFKEGIQVFKQQYLANGTTALDLDLRILMALGSLYWTEKLKKEEAAAEAARKSKETEAVTKRGDESDLELLAESGKVDLDLKEWTPERVAKTLKSVIRFGAFQIRRARWFCRLSEATLSWSFSGDTPEKKNLVLIAGGRLTFSDPIPLRDAVPPPLRHSRHLKARQTDFDIATFDRLRVITSEIRRLLEEGRAVELCPHPNVLLTNRSLNKMLTWL